MDEINQTENKDKTFENEYCLGVPALKANPKTLIGSYVIIPKSHVESPFDLTVDEWLATKDMMCSIKQYIDSKYNPDGYNIGWNVGNIAGQEVEYAHMHIIPRFRDEPYAGKGIRHWFKKDENIRSSFVENE
ncbi:MAG: HIT family protein [Parabacteroides sp.]|jgi:diadenosine tetraphosphate (Ap4A) HIT family hydrolase|nr:HIT family protein [Parabacteroides sp.]